MKKRDPKYRLHKASGQALVQLAGQRFYLGKYGTPESLEAYHRAVLNFHATGALPEVAKATIEASGGVRVEEVLSRYLTHAEKYYRDPTGKQTPELHCVALALAPVRKLYEGTEAAKFGPLALQAVRQAMIEKRWSRKNINRAVSRVVRMFRWASQNELVPPALYHGLKSVEGLKAGRSDAKETEPVKPVPQAYVDAVLAKDGPLVAYRWHGEDELRHDHLIAVGGNS